MQTFQNDIIIRFFYHVPLIIDTGYSERTPMWTLNINEEKKLLILRISDTLTLDELSDIQIARLQESKEQSKKGQTLSHDKVKSQYRK